MTEPRSVRTAIVAALIVYAVLWFAAAQRPAPNGDAVSTWGTLEPHRSVLCVEEGPRLLLAAAPEDADRAAVQAELLSSEVRWGGDLSVVHRDHAYRASLSVFGFELPWMKNEYTSGLPEWLPHGVFRLTRSLAAGQMTTMLLGALVLILCALTAARIGGWRAAALTGGLLAVDPAFHLWKKVAAGPEVALQLCAAAATLLCLRAIQERAPRRLMPAALLIGLGCHVKPSFVAFAAPLVLVTLPMLPWSALSRRGWIRIAAAALALALLGGSPSLIYWATQPAQSSSVGWQENSRDRLLEITRRLMPTKKGSPDMHSRVKDVSAARVLLVPGSWQADYYAIRDARGNDPDRAGDRPTRLERDRPPPLILAGAVASVALLLLAGIGALRRRSTILWAVALGLSVPFFVRAMHPDPHHIALTLPGLAVALGVGATAIFHGSLGRRVLLVLASVALLGRAADLRRIDPAIEERVGRLIDRSNWPPLIDALLAEGALNPAVLDYEGMSLVDLHSGGRVRPFLYARAGGDGLHSCLVAGSDAWLAAILRAHRGGHLLLLWGVDGMPTAAARSSWVEPNHLRDVARAADLGVARVKELRDSRGRWYATLYAITGGR